MHEARTPHLPAIRIYICSDYCRWVLPASVLPAKGPLHTLQAMGLELDLAKNKATVGGIEADISTVSSKVSQ